jgi:2-dehydro-3-deoxyphosphogalactonate aldolase
MTPQQQFEDAMTTLPLVAILRGLQAQESLDIGGALVALGWKLIEVPLNSPQPLLSIEKLAAAHPDVLIGAGTVLTPKQVREVQAAGGRLIVSPNFNADVIRAAAGLDMICLPGVATATEAFAAMAAGATGLKLFPAEMILPNVVKAFRAVLPPETAVMPVGGITPAGMDVYRAAGANGFGLGSALYKPGMDAATVAANARAFIAAWRANPKQP